MVRTLLRDRFMLAVNMETLESTRGPVELLVIDSAECPAEN
jgi:hypothetical protein